MPITADAKRADSHRRPPPREIVANNDLRGGIPRRIGSDHRRGIGGRAAIPALLGALPGPETGARERMIYLSPTKGGGDSPNRRGGGRHHGGRGWIRLRTMAIVATIATTTTAEMGRRRRHHVRSNPRGCGSISRPRDDGPSRHRRGTRTEGGGGATHQGGVEEKEAKKDKNAKNAHRLPQWKPVQKKKEGRRIRRGDRDQARDRDRDREGEDPFQRSFTVH